MFKKSKEIKCPIVNEIKEKVKKTKVKQNKIIF